MVAICSEGHIGLIMNNKKKVTWCTGVKTFAYIGIHLSKEKFGQEWASKNPTILGHISDVATGKAELKVSGSDLLEELTRNRFQN